MKNKQPGLTELGQGLLKGMCEVSSLEALDEANLKIAELEKCLAEFKGFDRTWKQMYEEQRGKLEAAQSELEHWKAEYPFNLHKLISKCDQLKSEIEHLKIELAKSGTKEFATNLNIDKLKSEIERLNLYTIAGHKQIEAEMKLEIDRLAKQNKIYETALEEIATEARQALADAKNLKDVK